MSFTKAWIDYIQKNFASQDLGLRPEVADNLVSSARVRLPKFVHTNAKQFIESLYRESRSPKSDLGYSGIVQEIAEFPSNTPSVLMAYDFHVNMEDHSLKLIEINTNAAGYLISQSIIGQHGIDVTRPLTALRESFAKAAGKSGPLQAAIIDEDPLNQKMYFEFLMYKKMFEDLGWSCEILDAAAIDPLKFDFIYNRATDFYFKDEKHKALRDAYLNSKTVISPNPREYFLTADKNRYLDWVLNPTHLSDDAKTRDFLLTHFIETFSAQSKSPEEIWAGKKQLFFKPKNSFGGKSVYKAESVSRKVFERVIAEDFLVQKYTPPGEVEIDGARWKFDLRFYVFEDQIQAWCARLYQGQVTNFRTPGGGFCPVEFS